MAQQSIPVGAGRQTGDGSWQWSTTGIAAGDPGYLPGNLEIDTELTAAGGAVLLEGIRVWPDLGVMRVTTMVVAGGADEDLSRALERSPVAFRFEVGADGWGVPGPDAEGSVSTDDSEPYNWIPAAGLLASFNTGYLAKSPAERANTMFVLNDGVVPETAPVSGVASITGIEVWEADLSSRVALPDNQTSLHPYVTKLQLKESLEDYGRREAVSTLQLGMNSPPVTVLDPPVFTERRVVRIIYENGAVDEFRIVKFGRKLDATADPALTLEPLWTDLGHRVSHQVIAGTNPRTDYEWYVNGTPGEALAAIMSRGAPPHFVAGAVDASFAAAKVYLHAAGKSALDMIRALCEAVVESTSLRCEWDVQRRTDGTYAVNIVPQVGGGEINHPVQGYVVTERSLWNRRKASLLIDSTQYFSRIIPLGGPDGEIGTVADASWIVDAVRTNTDGETEVVLGGDPIFIGGSPSGPSLQLQRVDGGAASPVAGTAVPDVVRLSVSEAVAAAAFPLGERVKFGFPAGELTYINDPGAESVAGVKERPLRRTDIQPYANLLADANVTTDMSEWDVTGHPLGVVASNPDPVGALPFGPVPVLTQSTDPEYVKAGTSAMEFEGDAGALVQTADIDLSEQEGYVSVWVGMRVLGGRFKLAVIDGEGREYPRDAEAVGVADVTFRGLELGGLKLRPRDDYKVRLTALDDETHFVVDAWTMTLSSAPVAWIPDMGPVALWNAGGTILAAEGGVQPVRYEGAWLDMTRVDTEEDYDPPTLGSTIMVKDVAVDLSSRIVDMTRTLASAKGTEEIRGRLGYRGADVTNWLTARGRRGAAGSIVPPTPTVPQVHVAIQDRRAQAVVRVVYPAGIRSVRIEVPVDPADLEEDRTAIDLATNVLQSSNTGPAGRVPVPVDVRNTPALPDNFSYVDFTGLEEDGGELHYQVGVTDLAGDGVQVEPVLKPGEERGQYRVFAIPADLPSARLAWAGVLRGTERSLGVEVGDVRRTTLTLPIVGTLRVLRLEGVRIAGTTDGLTGLVLVWKVDDGAWTPAVATPAGSAFGEVSPIIAVTGEGVHTFTLLVPLMRARYFTLAAREGQVASDFDYHGEVVFPVVPDVDPARFNLRALAPPTAEDVHPEGVHWEIPDNRRRDGVTMCLFVEASPGVCMT